MFWVQALCVAKRSLTSPHLTFPLTLSDLSLQFHAHHPGTSRRTTPPPTAWTCAGSPPPARFSSTAWLTLPWLVPGPPSRWVIHRLFSVRIRLQAGRRRCSPSVCSHGPRIRAKKAEINCNKLWHLIWLFNSFNHKNILSPVWLLLVELKVSSCSDLMCLQDILQIRQSSRS